MNHDRNKSSPAARPLSRREALALGAASAGILLLDPLISAGDAAAADGTEAFRLAVPPGALGPGGTSRVISAGRPFDLVGLLDPGRHGPVEVRARREGEAWSRWAELRESLDHGPDGGARAQASEPVWTGTCDEFQLRCRRRPSQPLRLQMVCVPARARSAGARLAAERPARVSASRPPIIPRSAWGAARVPPRTRPAFGQVVMAFVHHTEGVNNYSRSQSASVVLAIARYHRDGRGWNDIGYNFLVDRFGRIFEGRAGGVTMPVIGAQAGGWNSVSTGVAVMGSFTGVAAPRAVVEAVGALLGWKLPLHAVPVDGSVTITSGGGPENRWPAGRRVAFRRISGHRDGCSTDCPGNLLYAQLPAIRRLAADQEEQAPPEAYVTLVGPASATWGRKARLRGAVTNGDQTARGGEKVVVERQSGSGRWREVGTATSADDGTWSLELTVRSSRVLRARSAGVESPPISLEVRPLVSAAVQPAQVQAPGTVRVTGEARPNGPVEVIVERRLATRWARVAVRAGRASPGFSVSVTLKAPGSYRLVVRATRGTRTTSADPLSVRVVAVPSAVS